MTLRTAHPSHGTHQKESTRSSNKRKARAWELPRPRMSATEAVGWLRRRHVEYLRDLNIPVVLVPTRLIPGLYWQPEEAQRPFDSLAIEVIDTDLSCIGLCEPPVACSPPYTSRREPAGLCRVTRSSSPLAHAYICATYLHVHAVRPNSCWPCCGAP